ncbi:hypothetical protein BDF22DRAFT_496361 [Syncephalis plumigaleata]|nr:hypothetical protein BDF22DRAFT_496361 [Syncephalis plumigaleata]
MQMQYNWIEHHRNSARPTSLWTCLYVKTLIATFLLATIGLLILVFGPGQNQSVVSSTHSIIGYVSYVLLGVYLIFSFIHFWWRDTTSQRDTRGRHWFFWAVFLGGICAWLLAVASLIIGVQLIDADAAYLVLIGAYLQVVLIILVRRAMLQWETGMNDTIEDIDATSSLPASIDTEKTLVA